MLNENYKAGNAKINIAVVQNHSNNDLITFCILTLF